MPVKIIIRHELMLALAPRPSVLEPNVRREMAERRASV
jgi:hypothetical protein